MKYLSANELREKRNNFWESKKHLYLPEVSLISSKGSSSLFNVAGMQQLMPYLSGKDHSLGKRLYNIQKCVRTVDIDEVGDLSHLTFFEMMGNRSLGDYYKKESITWSYKFLVDVLGFDPQKLSVTVFTGDKDSPRDEESFAIWKSLGLGDEKITYLGKEENRWSLGSVGPCGPDTEIFYWIGNEPLPIESSNPGNDEENRLEVWNNVFMEYYCDEEGKLSVLPKKNVDTGMGFERMCMVLQTKETIFETDLFIGLIRLVEKYTSLKYDKKDVLGLDQKIPHDEIMRRFRIIVDHIRSAIMMINDGVIQSNVGSGYVLRMLIRRMYYNMMILKDIPLEELQNFLQECVQDPSHVREFNVQEVVSAIYSEIEQFKKTIENGLKLLRDKLSHLSSGATLLGKDAFFLYDTCGFPLELTKEICIETGTEVDELGFQAEMEEQKQRSRSSAKKLDKSIDRSSYLEGIPETILLGYEQFEISNSNLLKDFEVDGQRVLIFNQTPFYAESGGQKGDSGEIELDSREILKIRDVIVYEGVFLHLVE